jgi:3',5'-cyclic AMP phosphodiesterase CpdA
MRRKVVYLIILLILAIAFSSSYSNLIQTNIEKIESLTSTSSEINILTFGDTKDGIKILKNLINSANKENYDFAIYTGDSVRYGDYHLFKDFASIMSNLKRPYVTVMGNHEYYNDDGENYSKFYGKNNYSFVYKDMAIISFDDANPNSWRIDWKWLKKEVQKYNNDPKIDLILLAMHIPPVDPRPDGYHCLNKFYQSRLLDAIKNSKVKLIVSGHIHLYWYGDWNGFKVLITGGAGAPLYAGPKDGGFYHYTIVHIKNGNITVSLKKVK